MYDMFSDCQALTTLDLSSFDTGNVTSFGYMFNGCSKLESIDLSSFNTSKVTFFDYMFYNCKKLTTVFVGDYWNTDAATSSNDMFTNCTGLVGGAGTPYNSSHTDAAYAHADGGTAAPGYFTYKANFQVGDVNKDGSITIADVTALVNIILGKTTDYDLRLTDVNTDGSVTIADVTKLVNKILGKE